MNRISALLGGVSSGVVIALLVVLLLQLILQAVSLIDLARRRTVLGGRKWVWVLVIILGNLVGTVVYLAVGRQPSASPGSVDDRPGSAEARKQALDRLYGPDRKQR